MKRLFLFMVLILNFLIGVSKAEVFYLKNGEIVKGSIAKEKDQLYKIADAQITHPKDGSVLFAKSYFLQKDEILKVENDDPIQDNSIPFEFSELNETAEFKTEEEYNDYSRKLEEHWDKTILPKIEKVKSETGWEPNQDMTEEETASAASILRTLSMATETYAMVNSGRFPEDVSELTSSQPSYINFNPCQTTQGGYTFVCHNGIEGYKYTAIPVNQNNSEALKYSIVTGGILSEEK